ncbi:CPBP family glutamic-type intramembrane protease [Methanobrevibacter sp.]
MGNTSDSQSTQMETKDFFRFENENEDFPFYNDNPKLTKNQWITLIIGVLATITFLAWPKSMPQYITSITLFLLMIIPISIVSRGKLGYLFKIPKKRDIVLIILLYIGYYIYVITVAALLFKYGYDLAFNKILTVDDSKLMLLGAAVQLIGEELIKVIPFLIILHVSYKHNHNRKRSFLIALTFTLILFSLLHYKAYDGHLLQIFLIIGLGSIFDMLAYFTTKNVTVSYILHIMIDLLPLLSAL